jgi:LPXTG-motif cell wall-anchored protein
VKKTVLTIALAVVLTMAFVLPAMAANVDLPLTLDAVNNDTQKGWGTAGFEDEGVSESVAVESLVAATHLVIEVSGEPGFIQLILQTPAGWWQQSEFSGDAFEAIYSDGKITFDLKNLPGSWNFDEDDLRAKFLLGFYDDGVDDLGITKAYLVVPGAGGSSAPSGTPGAKTGDSTMIALAISALLLAAGATVVVVRKIKA